MYDLVNWGLQTSYPDISEKTCVKENFNNGLPDFIWTSSYTL
jgi:hypothetical protein